MDKNLAAASFAALAQPTRIDVLRLLISFAPDGMPAGEIAARLQVRQNTMSANLAVLLRAGLVRNRRRGRTILYFADFEGIRALLGFLMEDCCGGRPELCKTLIDEIACA